MSRLLNNTQECIIFPKTISLKTTTLVLSVSALLTCSEMFAAPKTCINRGNLRGIERGVEPAQANYQDETILIPVLDDPISFSVKNLRTNIGVNSDKTVFKVHVPGLYSIDSFLLLNVPTIEDTVEGYITINGKKFLTFFSSETRTAGPIVEFHFNDRLAYLKKGDEVSVIFSEFAPGTTILSRGFIMVALNNSN